MLSFEGVSRTVLTLGWVSLITDISSEMVTAVLPLFVIVQLGMSPFAYGMLEGIYQGGTIIARLLGGYLADRQPPNFVATAGYALSALCKPLLVFATGLGALFAIIALDRCGKGLRTAPRDAMIAAATPPSALGRAFGVHRTFDTLGALIGPIGAWLLLILATDDFTLVFLVSFCVALIAVAFLNPEKAEGADPQSGAGEVIDQTAIREALANGRYLKLVFVCTALSLATISDSFLYLTLSQSGAISTALFPLLFVGTNIVYLCFALLLGNIADRIGRNTVLILGYGFLLCAYLGAGFLTSWAAIVVCLFFLGLHYAATDGMLPAAAAPLLPAHLRATGISVLQSTGALGKMAGAIFFGAIWSQANLALALWLFAAGLTIAIIFAAKLLLSRRTEGAN